MENENNSCNKGKDRVNENDTRHATHIPESISDQLYDSIVRIEKDNMIGTGFFMKLNLNGKIKYFLFTCCHVLNQNDVENKKKITLFYGKKREEKNIAIILDNEERFIICFPSSKDVTVIEILEKDNIPKSKYLKADLSYKYGYDTYKKGKFILAGYPSDAIYQKERHIASGEIKDIIDFEFSHSLDTRSGSSGSPICLFSNIQVIGIHKQGDRNKAINYGTFIGIIIDELEQKYKEINKNINNNINNNRLFLLLKDFCNEKNIEYQKELVYYINHQSKDNYLKALTELKEYISNNNIDELKGKDLNNFFDILKIYESVNNNYKEIIRNYTNDNGIYRYFISILTGKNDILRHKIIYFLAGFLKSLNNIKENYQLKKQLNLYYGINLKDFNDLDFFKKNVGEIICLKSFMSTSKKINIAESYVRGKPGSVIFEINYKYNKNYLPDCFDITDLSFYKSEEECLFKPYSFFKIMDIKIDENEGRAEIFLNYIGKSKNFELNLDLLNQGKNIQYNSYENLLEII